MQNRQKQDLAHIVNELIRVGTVSSTNDAAGTARVLFPDRNNTVSYDLPVVVRNTRKNKDYWMPDVGEQVLCLFLPTGIEQGYIIGSFYTAVTNTPVSTKDKRHTVFDDGTAIEYDRDAHRLRADLGQSKIDMDRSKILLESNGCSIEVSGSGIRIIGPVTQTGGDLTSDGISAQFHTHGGVASGSSNTSTPN